MSGHDSAYRILGLRPGAKPAEVEEAYRRLIKRYHPDRTGGDSSRAAEINRAYAQLRRAGSSVARPRRPVVQVRPAPRPTGGRRAALLLASGLVVLVAVGISYDEPQGRSRPLTYSSPIHWTAPAYGPPSTARSSPATAIDEPLHGDVIDRSIADAIKFHAQGDAGATAEFSRSCHASLREKPSLVWFDACSAFDEATVTLNGEGPMTNSGTFSASAVIGRQMAAARLLSVDSQAADARLSQIRSRVDLIVVPKMDEAAASRP